MRRFRLRLISNRLSSAKNGKAPRLQSSRGAFPVSCTARMNLPDIIQEHTSLTPYTTFKVGGEAECLAEVTTLAELKEVLAWAQQEQLSVTILGGGSNVVVPDSGLSGLTIIMHIAGFEFVEEGAGIKVTAGAGMSWDAFVARCVEAGWWGVENLSGIPGTVGATPIQNVGAYGVEVQDVIESVATIHKDTLAEKIFSTEECQFAYRDSFFKSVAGQGYIVTVVTFRLQKNGAPKLQYKDLDKYFEDYKNPTLADIRTAVLEIRAAKFPDLTKVGTAGSFFKNPVVRPEIFATLGQKFPDLPGHETDGGIKLSAAWLIDKVAGYRGVRKGAMGTHDKQALVMVNYGGATAHDVWDFSEEIIAAVKTKTDITLEREVTFLS